MYTYVCICIHTHKSGHLADSVIECVTLDLRVVSSSSKLGVKITLKNKILKKIRDEENIYSVVCCFLIHTLELGQPHNTFLIVVKLNEV